MLEEEEECHECTDECLKKENATLPESRRQEGGGGFTDESSSKS